mgnify:CR=1 FL=1
MVPLEDLDGDGYPEVGVQMDGASTDEVGTVIIFGSPEPPRMGEAHTLAEMHFLGAPVPGQSFISAANGSRMLSLYAWQLSLFVEPQRGATYDFYSDGDFELYQTEEDGPINGTLNLGLFGSMRQTILAAASRSPEKSGAGACMFWQSGELDEDGVFASGLEVNLVGEPGDNACSAAALVGDHNDDGGPDLLIGASAADGSSPDVGEAYLFFSP